MEDDPCAAADDRIAGGTAADEYEALEQLAQEHRVRFRIYEKHGRGYDVFLRDAHRDWMAAVNVFNEIYGVVRSELAYWRRGRRS